MRVCVNIELTIYYKSKTAEDVKHEQSPEGNTVNNLGVATLGRRVTYYPTNK